MRLRGGGRTAVVILLAAAAIAARARAATDGHPQAAPGAMAARPLEVRVTGSDFKWLIRYAGPDGRLDTEDDVLTQRHLQLPARAEVTIDLRSDDYVYTFLVPDLDLAEMAVPGKPFLMRLETEEPGAHSLRGSQMCGFTHPDLIGEVVVQPRAGFDDWLAAQRADKGGGR